MKSRICGTKRHSSLDSRYSSASTRAGLYRLGIPKDSIVQYETAIKTGKFVLIAHGSPQETTRAQEVISRTSPADRRYRKHPDVHPDRGRVGDSKHSPYGLPVYVRETGFPWIAE
jgi:hypothetical protein